MLALSGKLNALGAVSDQTIRLEQGRLREIDGWYPRPLGRGTLEPATRVVLQIASEALPGSLGERARRGHRAALAARSAGLDPIVVTEPGSGTGGAAPDAIDEVPYFPLPGPATPTRVAAPDALSMFADGAAQIAESSRPMAIHAVSGRRGFETALVGMGLAEAFEIPFVYEVVSAYEATWTGTRAVAETGEAYLRRRATERMCLDRADAIITPTNALRDELVAEGCEAAKVHVIPDCVDERVLAAGVGLAETRDFGRADMRIGAIASMEGAAEGHVTLLRAVAALAEKGVDVRCVLIGNGAREDALEAAASQLGVSDRCEFAVASTLTDLIVRYGDMDYFVMPRLDRRVTRYVAPTAVIDAMAMGCCVVASRLPGLHEVVASQRGLAFRPGQAGDLARVLEMARDSPETSREIAARGRSWVESTRRSGALGPAYANVYQAATRRRTKAAG